MAQRNGLTAYGVPVAAEMVIDEEAADGDCGNDRGDESGLHGQHEQVTEDHQEHQPNRDDGRQPEEEREYRIHALIYPGAL